MAHRRRASEPPSSSPLPRRARSCCPSPFTSCFGGGGAMNDETSFPASSTYSPTSWLPNIRGKYRTFISQFGLRRHHSADFRYDPLDYALNFDEGPEDNSPEASADEIRARSFSLRLPASPRFSHISRIQPN